MVLERLLFVSKGLLFMSTGIVICLMIYVFNHRGLEVLVCQKVLEADRKV